MHWVTYRRAPLAVPADAPGHHHGHRRRQDPDHRLGRGESAAQGLRRGPAAHPVRARQGRAADPHLRLRVLPGGHPGLAEVPVAGRELPQVRQRELRHRQDLRLRRQHHRRTPRSPPTRPARPRTPWSATRKRSWPPPSVPSRRCSPTRTPPPPPRTRRSPPPAARSAPRRRTSRTPSPPGRRSRRNCPPTRSTQTPAPRCCAPGAAACRWCCGCSRTTPSTGSLPGS